MRTTPWTDDHDRLVAEAAPAAPEAVDIDIDRVWHRVHVTMTEEARKRRGLRLLAAGVLAAGVLGGTAVATADHFSARTGKGPVDAEDLRLGGPGESLDVGAPDYGEVVAEESADIPFPTEGFRAIAIRHQLHDVRFAGPGEQYVSTGALRAWLADQALCAWSSEWAAATRSGDEAARTEAIETIQAAPTWPAVVDLDPAPYSRMESGEEEGEDGEVRTFRYRDESQFYYLAALGEAVDGRSIDAVAEILAENNGYCRPELVPDIPRADAMARFAER